MLSSNDASAFADYPFCIVLKKNAYISNETNEVFGRRYDLSPDSIIRKKDDGDSTNDTRRF